MPSQRNNLGEFNVNDSKNTRMEMDRSLQVLDIRKDEIMHMFRYQNGAKTIIDLAKQLGRPIRVLDIGCGEMNTARMLYHSFIEKKADVVSQYIGVDIDYQMIEKANEKYGKAYAKCSAEFLQKDLTVDPHLDFEDGHFDLIICFEFLEHIKTQFAPAILKEAFRVLRKGGTALFSTPNSNGSNAVLPKDHVYEYSYQELMTMFPSAGFKVEDTVGVCINVSKIPKDELEDYESEVAKVYAAFGNNTAASSVALAPLFSPEYCKNVLYRLSK